MAQGEYIYYDKAMLENFTEGIAPATVRAMMMFLGSDFRFVDSKENPTFVTHEVDLVNCVIPGGTIQYADSKKSEKGVEYVEYKYWTLADHTFATEKPEKGYYVYAQVATDGSAGEFLVSESAKGKLDDAGYYNLLVGIINSEYNGLRSYASLVGFTEILPGMVRTDKIVSKDGDTYFDLQNNEIVGRMRFLDGLISGDISIQDSDGRETAGIKSDGSFFATKATISGNISAESGNITENVTVKGSIVRPFIDAHPDETLKTGSHDHVYLRGSTGAFNLVWDQTQNGRVITLIRDGDGFVTITAPSSKYAFFEDGKRKSFINFSNRIVQLLGVGDQDLENGEFRGWAVISSEYYETFETLGKTVKALCYGKVVGTEDGATITSNCFDDYYNREKEAIVSGNSLTVSRLAKGEYRIEFPTEWNIGNISPDYVVICTGGLSTSGRGVFASVQNQTTSYFDIRLADDASANDGTFYFQMLNTGAWL